MARQLGGRGTVVCIGDVVGATPVLSASIKRDGETGCAGHRWQQPMHSYKAHVVPDPQVRSERPVPTRPGTEPGVPYG